nr:MFS transporter [Candidatus Njordarchaeum guaymaensis]
MKRNDELASLKSGIGLGRKIVYTFGNLGSPLFYNVVAVYLMDYYQSIVGLDIGLYGLALMIYGIWNAFNDPIAGYVTDRTKTRWGRRIPFVAFLTPLTLVFFILVWFPALVGAPLAVPYNITMFFYLLITLSIFDTFYTFVTVPYFSLYIEMFPDFKERTNVNASRQLLAMLGLILAFALPPVLVSTFSEGSNQLPGYLWMGLILGSIAAAMFLLSILGSRERPEFYLEPTLPPVQAIKQTLKNKAFLTFVGANLMIQYTWLLLPAFTPLFTRYILNDFSLTTLLLGAMFISAIPFLFLWQFVNKRLGTKRTLMIAMTWFGVSCLPLLFAADLTLILVTLVLIGIGLSGVMMTHEIALGDAIDEDEIVTGKRREGVFYGINTFVVRWGFLLVALTDLVFLGMRGFVYPIGGIPQPQPAAVLDGIRQAISIVPFLALIVGVLIFKFYPIHGERFIKLKQDLAKLHKEKAKRIHRK